jgi:hypothetical protein
MIARDPGLGKQKAVRIRGRFFLWRACCVGVLVMAFACQQKSAPALREFLEDGIKNLHSQYSSDNRAFRPQEGINGRVFLRAFNGFKIGVSFGYD